MEEPSPSGRKTLFCGPKSGGMGRPDERGTLSQCAPIAEHDMAKVEWSTGIDSVSGALSKPSKSGQHSCTKMLLSTPVSSDERAQRTRFGAICKAVALRRKDLAHVAEDLAAFNAQKDTAGGYKTMRQYLWHICAAEYNG